MTVPHPAVLVFKVLAHWGNFVAKVGHVKVFKVNADIWNQFLCRSSLVANDIV